MIASSPAVPKQEHVVTVPLTDSTFPAVHDGHFSSPFTVQHPFALCEVPSLHTYAFAESIREDAHAMSAKHRKKRGVFVNAPPKIELLMVLANISVCSQVSFAEVKFGLQKFAVPYILSRAIFILFMERKETKKD